MSHEVTSAITVEVEAELRGTFQPGYPATGPSYASGGEPGVPDGIEDGAVTGLFIERRARDQHGLPVYEKPVDDGFGTTPRVGGPKYERVDLLAGLPDDVRAQVLQAVTEALRHEAYEALLEDAADLG